MINESFHSFGAALNDGSRGPDFLTSALLRIALVHRSVWRHAAWHNAVAGNDIPRNGRRPFRHFIDVLLRYVFLIVLLTVGSAIVVTRVDAQIYKLPRVDAAPSDYFGVDVAIDSNRVVVGATGIDSCGTNAGAAYVYEQDSRTGQWALVSTLMAEDCAAGDFFGRTVAISGAIVVVSAFHGSMEGNANVAPNAVYVFEPDSSGVWAQTARLSTGTDDIEGRFAADVAIDNERIAVSTAGDLTGGTVSGAVYIFERNASDRWKRTARLSAAKDVRGYVIGGTLAMDGDRVLIGASTALRKQRGAAYLFDFDPATNEWEWTGRITGLDDFFIAASLEGDRALIGERKAGRKAEGTATVFERSPEGEWKSAAQLAPANPFEDGAFGSAVALDGSKTVVIGYDEQLRFDYNIDRVGYVFERQDSGEWKQRHIIDIGEVFFGSAIDIDNGVAAIGQASDGRVGEALVIVLN